MSPLSPQAFLDVASHLLALAEDEQEPAQLDTAALTRSAISRAYYACFLTARDILARHYHAKWPRGGKGHKMIEDVLKKAKDKELQAWGRRFAALRTARRKADYDLSATHIEGVKNAQFNVEEARGFLDFLQQAEQSDFEGHYLVQQLQLALGEYDATHNPR